MAQLREFHLQLAFMGPGPLGEDVQDQRGAVQHPALAPLLDVALLHGGQRLADQHQVGARGLDRVGELVDLAPPDEIARVGAVARSRYDGRHLDARRVRKLREFIQRFRPGSRKHRVQYDGAIAALGAIDQMGYLAGLATAAIRRPAALRKP